MLSENVLLKHENVAAGKLVFQDRHSWEIASENFEMSHRWCYQLNVDILVWNKMYFYLTFSMKFVWFYHFIVVQYQYFHLLRTWEKNVLNLASENLWLWNIVSRSFWECITVRSPLVLRLALIYWEDDSQNFRAPLLHQVVSLTVVKSRLGLKFVVRNKL